MAKNAKNKQTPVTASIPKNFTIKYPLIWLIAAVLIVYLPSLQLGYTDLDDTIFIRELHTFNEDLSNLFTAFHRGVFDAVKDSYYRPIFLDSMILNYQVSGNNIEGYHFVNLLLHLLSVILLFRLFKKIGVKELHAFLLTLIFAVHPILSQAVVWIPGRNDTLMAVFVLPFLLFSVGYAQQGKIKDLLFSLLFLLLAFFTKETALLAPLASFVLLTMILGKKWTDRNNLIQYGVWIVGLIIYFAMRATATLKTSVIDPIRMLQDFFSRLPVIVQYIGKIFLPFNQSVFPIMQDTVYYYGVAAVILLIVVIMLAKEKSHKNIIAGFALFIIFLLPVLFVPNALNEQVFEHRLYLPIIGILLVLPETVLLRNRLKPAQLTTGFVAAACILGILNYRHQQNFKDPLAFWEQAYATSPHSAYATMMYAARMEGSKKESYVLMRKAYALNPHEKYLNYYYGVMLQEQDSLLESEKYFLNEKNTSGYYECDFYLSRIAYEKKNVNQAIQYMETYLEHDPDNRMANNNLLLMYMETKQKTKAQRQVKSMQEKGLTLPQVTIRQVEALP